jgi:nucleoside diphosphate kinase
MTIEKSFLLVKPDGVLLGGVEAAREALGRARLVITEQRAIRLTVGQVGELYAGNVNAQQFWREEIDYLTKSESVMLDIEGESAVEKVKQIKGKTKQSGLRLQFASNHVHNAFHCPDTAESRDRELVVLGLNVLPSYNQTARGVREVRGKK